VRFLKKRCLDYENANLQLRFKRPMQHGARLLESFFRNWLDDRQRRGICPCPVKEVIVHVSTAGDTAEVFCGWCCDTCLADLKGAIKKGMADIGRVVVGVDADGYPAPDKSLLAVGPKSVTFEDGRIVEVAPFRICRSRVTLGEFERFTRQTGYVTTAETAGDNISFRHNEVIEAVNARDRRNVPVSVVSFPDVLGYCKWASVRLPTEAEWLAASLIDDRIMDRDGVQRFLFDDHGKFASDRFPTALKDLASEWVIGEAPDGEAVVRHGPHYMREVGWEARASRSFWPVNSYDLTVGFRVAKVN
jgi:hypothetical protein